MTENEEGTEGLESFLNDQATQAPPQQQPAPAAAPTIPQPTAQAPARRGNEVFGKAPPAPPAQPQDGPVTQMTRDEYVKRELGYEIPIDAVPLPSAGLIYPVSHPLHNCPDVQYRAMTAKEEDILMSPALVKSGKVISELIKSCLTDKRIDVRTLLSGDQQAIMLGIRMSGYGNLYEPKFACPKCEVSSVTQIDLADFDIRPLEIAPVEPGQNLFVFDLPLTKKKIHFKFLTVAEEEASVRAAEMKKKKGIKKDNLVTTQLMNSIVAVDGDQAQGYIAKFVQHMPARDSHALRQYILKNQPSVETKFDFLCDNCEHYEKADMPMTIEFFWPGSSDA